MSVSTIKELCQAAGAAFEAGDPAAALTRLEAATSLVDGLPRPHHARLMWLVAMAWIDPSSDGALLAEAEALALGDLDPDHAAVGLFQLARLAAESRRPGAAPRLGANLLAVVAKAQGEGHPQYFEWQRRLASLMDSSS
jgi:hypothetical protein